MFNHITEQTQFAVVLVIQSSDTNLIPENCRFLCRHHARGCGPDIKKKDTFCRCSVLSCYWLCVPLQHYESRFKFSLTIFSCFFTVLLPVRTMLERKRPLLLGQVLLAAHCPGNPRTVLDSQILQDCDILHLSGWCSPGISNSSV